MSQNPFIEIVGKFEESVAEYFGAPYAVAVDCCTHAVELSLRHEGYKVLTIPKRTYASIPMTAMKIGASFTWTDEEWEDYYYIGNTNVIDAATVWRENSYIPNTYMCLSFQFKKHLSLGRGGMILLDNRANYERIKKMSYDGRNMNFSPWGNYDIDTIGYHYYMTPETASLGLQKLEEAKNKPATIWDYTLYPDLSKMSVFKGKV